MSTSNNIPRPNLNETFRLALLSDGNDAKCFQHVISITTSCEFGKIATAEIVLENVAMYNQDEPIGDTDLFLIGKEIEVKAGYEEPSETLFKGVIVKQAINYSRGQAQLVVTAKHKAYKMTLNRQFRNFEDMTDKDIIEEICGNYGIDIDVEDSTFTHERMVQYNCSDWDFINLRAEANGWLLFTSNDGIVVKKPDMSADPVLLVASDESIYDINTEIDRENQIISDLLTLVKLEGKATSLKTEKVHINGLTEIVIKRILPLAEEQHVEVVVENQRDVYAEVDENSIIMALTNILENSVKYNKKNGSVRVTVNADWNNCFITIRDTGIGIPEESLSHLFEKFYRVDKARSRETGGSGLGLSIAYEIVKAHNGDIKVFSKLQKGTKFVITLPLVASKKEVTS